MGTIIIFLDPVSLHMNLYIEFLTTALNVGTWLETSIFTPQLQQGKPCRVPTHLPGEIRGSVSCPWTLHNLAWRNPESNQWPQVIRQLLYPWTTATSVWNKSKKYLVLSQHGCGKIGSRSLTFNLPIFTCANVMALYPNTEKPWNTLGAWQLPGTYSSAQCSFFLWGSPTFHRCNMSHFCL